jgi:hypothetical protein
MRDGQAVRQTATRATVSPITQNGSAVMAGGNAGLYHAPAYLFLGAAYGETMQQCTFPR